MNMISVMTVKEADRILRVIEAEMKNPAPAECLERHAVFAVPASLMHELVMAWKAVRNAADTNLKDR